MQQNGKRNKEERKESELVKIIWRCIINLSPEFCNREFRLNGQQQTKEEKYYQKLQF